MARKRIIDPDFWLKEDITSCSYETRLFYIGTWNFSDDYGVIEDSIPKLKAQIFPYDPLDVTPLRAKLVEIGKLIPFEADGKRWLYIKNFLEWQKVEKPSLKRNPSPPDNLLVGEELGSSNQPVGSEVKLSKEKLREVKYIPEDLKSAELLYHLILTRNPDWYVKPKWDDWAEDIRKIRELDGRTTQQIDTIIKWAQNDNFWCSNILSPAKLRKQFNTLVVQMGNEVRSSMPKMSL